MTTSASMHVVLADDLTGAVEVAATAQRFGIRSIVHMGNLAEAPLLEADILQVIDTETRLMSAQQAARQVLATLGLLKSIGRPFEIIFKKTDSALRGPIAAEVFALAEALEKPRILFVPANPAAGRTIANGIYTINGMPLQQTSFARDPHHPATSASVVDLLARSGWPAAVSVAGDDDLPVGLLVGDATSEADLSHWAAALGASTLAAGSAAFFAALLEREHRPTATHTEVKVPENLLLISGTTDTFQKSELARLGHSGQSLPELLEAAAQARGGRIASAGSGGCRVVYLHPDHPVVTAEADTIRDALAEIAAASVRQDQRLHLVIEGGATAAAIARACGWYSFEMKAEWAPGVVCLQPCGAEQTAITLKPGSYPWPQALQDLMDQRTEASISN